MEIMKRMSDNASKRSFPNFHEGLPVPGTADCETGKVTMEKNKSETDDFLDILFGCKPDKKEILPGNENKSHSGIFTALRNDPDAALDPPSFQDMKTNGLFDDETLKRLEGESGREAEPEIPISPESVEFGRNSVMAEGVKRVSDADNEEETGGEEAEKGFMPPLSVDFSQNTEISLKDCVYSMLLGEIYEAKATKKYQIYFMVAPFEIKENEPSSNILMYAFYKGRNYALTSLNNNEKNSLLCQIAEFQFLIRGHFANGIWNADIQLTGESLKRRDVFDVIQIYHNNPPSMGSTNGHIRFLYQGYINHRNLTSTGCVDVFPMDNKGETFVVVRCIEDFIDIFYTDETPEIELRTPEGMKALKISCQEGTAYAVTEQAESKNAAGGIFSE